MLYVLTLIEETTSRAAAVQQDATKVHLLSLTHIHTHINQHKHKESTKNMLLTQIGVCTYMLLGLSTVWSTNRTEQKASKHPKC